MSHALKPLIGAAAERASGLAASHSHVVRGVGSPDRDRTGGPGAPGPPAYPGAPPNRAAWCSQDAHWLAFPYAWAGGMLGWNALVWAPITPPYMPDMPYPALGCWWYAPNSPAR